MYRDNQKNIHVKLYKLGNRLKSKMGLEKNKKEGFIDPDAIKEADGIIADLCITSSDTITENLKILTVLWDEMKDMPAGDARVDLSNQVFTLAHEIKDIGSMCGHDVVAYFAESLRDFIHSSSLSVNAQRVIVRAHMDAMQATHKAGVKNEGGQMSEELKMAVKKAIEKYS